MVLNNITDWPKSRYNSKIHNIATEFFIPALKESTTYRRIGGFFSSTSLALAARGIKELIENDGKMQLIVSPILTKEDSVILNNCDKTERNEIIHKSLVNELDLIEEFEKKHVAALAYLLKKDFLEIKIDIPMDLDGHHLDYASVMQRNILDEKLGIFQDRNGNAISFRGPVNENRESWEHGIFSITVDVDWIEGQKRHVLDDVNRFQKKWTDSNTLDLPKSTKNQLLQNTPNDISSIDLSKFNVPTWAMLPNGNVLWDHQIRAVNSWYSENNLGIFNIATSGGKTLSALVSASLTPKETIIVILVPTRVLITQWEKEIRQFDPNMNLIICDSDHSEWDVKLPYQLNAYIGNDEISRNNHLVILSTMSTAKSQKFINNFEGILPKFITVIADEVHHLGAPEFGKVFNINAKRRLGLSATFKRDWDEIGTNRILDYFGQPIDEIYTVADGIRDEKLSRYNYHIYFAFLNNNEFADYIEHSAQISQLYAKIKSTKNIGKKLEFEKKYQRLVMNRAEIIKKAEDKINTYEQILLSSPKKPYIVFADDNEQVNKLKKIHKKTIQRINSKKQNNFETDDIMTFSGNLSDSIRNKILEESKNNQTPIFAMYCLDEGVDVPEFQSAILVSSSASKRQYIQRRGRILRTSVKEKTAHLYDIVVLPNFAVSSKNQDQAKDIINKEKERVEELAKDAINKWDVDSIFYRKLKEIGFDHS